MTEQVVVPTMLDPRLFQSIMRLAKDGLAYGGNHVALRNDINSLLFELKRMSKDCYGLDSVEAIHVLQLLRRTAPPRDSTKTRPQQRLGSVQLLEQNHRLDDDQLSALSLIRRPMSGL